MNLRIIIIGINPQTYRQRLDTSDSCRTRDPARHWQDSKGMPTTHDRIKLSFNYQTAIVALYICDSGTGGKR